jgi:hypothetical protein
MCVLDKKAYSGGSCMIRYHCDTFFGLAKCDAEMCGVKAWKAANENKIKRHAVFMRTLAEDLEQDEFDLNRMESTAV